MPTFVFIVFLIPFFLCFERLFLCFSQSGVGFHCLNFVKFRDTVPLRGSAEKLLQMCPHSQSHKTPIQSQVPPPNSQCKRAYNSYDLPLKLVVLF